MLGLESVWGFLFYQGMLDSMESPDMVLVSSLDDLWGQESVGELDLELALPLADKWEALEDIWVVVVDDSLAEAADSVQEAAEEGIDTREEADIVAVGIAQEELHRQKSL